MASLTKMEVQKKKASKKYMTKEQLLARYGDKDLVEDLIKRKVDSGLSMPDPEFPKSEEHRLYLCFDSQKVEENDVTESAIKVGFQAEVDKDCEASKGALSVFFAQDSAASGDGKKGNGRTNRKKSDAEKNNNTKRSNVNERSCRQKLRELGVLKIECKAWQGCLDDTDEMPAMKEALKKDMNVFVERLQQHYDKVENTIVEKANDEALKNVMQEADSIIKEYTKASDYCRKLIAKAKPKAKAKAARAKQ